MKQATGDRTGFAIATGDKEQGPGGKRQSALCRSFYPDAVMLGITYHWETQRSYIFVLHPERKEFCRALLKDFLETAWKDCVCISAPSKDSRFKLM